MRTDGEREQENLVGTENVLNLGGYVGTYTFTKLYTKMGAFS